MEIKDKLGVYLNSQIGKDIQTIAAYTVRKTATEKDDEILDNVDDVNDVISDFIDGIADIEPTDKEAKDAVLRILKQIAAQTKTKVDDMIVGIVDTVL